MHLNKEEIKRKTAAAKAYKARMFALFDWQIGKTSKQASRPRLFGAGDRHDPIVIEAAKLHVPGLFGRMRDRMALTPTQFYRYMNRY